MRIRLAVGAAVSLLLAMASPHASAQPLTVGVLGTPTGTFGPGVTVIDFYAPASRVGDLTSATFMWSAAPCKASVKIKVGYQIGDLPPFHFWHFLFVDERGPFDVSQTTQTVALVPPLRVGFRYQIAIFGANSCGGPASGEPKAPPGGSLVSQGDRNALPDQAGLFTPSTPSSVLVQGSDDSVVLLNNRFRATLTATDPRTGRTTAGRGITLGDRFGYFSLPEFTGDPDFPEVIIKMADMTAFRRLDIGGSFWVFYSSLTDVQYTLTVTDQASGRTRTYSNVAGSPGQLCGGADTDAFPP